MITKLKLQRLEINLISKNKEFWQKVTARMNKFKDC